MKIKFAPIPCFCILPLLALSVAGCRKHDFPQYPANYREYAYVTNGGSGTVSIYDVVNVRLDRELAVGQNPVAVAVNPARKEVYVVNAGVDTGMGSVSVIDARTNSIAATIAVQRQPVAMEVTADGERAFVANSGANSVSVLDLKARREVAQIRTGEVPVALRISHDQKTLVVANRGTGSLGVYDAATGKLRAEFGGCPGAADAVILPDSSKAFVACSAGHQILAVALAHLASGTTPAQPDRLEAVLDVGRGPLHLAMKPDGGELFVANSMADSISEVSTYTDEVSGAYMMGSQPVRSLVSSDNSLLYVGNLRSQEVTIYSIEDGKRAGSIHVGDGPSALAFSASGHLLFVVDAHSGDVAVVRTRTPQSLFTMLSAGRNPNAIAIEAFQLP